MNEKELIQNIANETGAELEIVEKVFNAASEQIVASLKRCESVTILSFGRFYIRPGDSETSIFKFNPSQSLGGIFMAVWVEYNDAYEVRLHRTNLRKIQEVETDEGIILFFGERPSKPGSPQLMSVAFLKEYWTIEEAVLWWTDHQIYFVPKSLRGKKNPHIDWIIDNGRNYILACSRGRPKNDTIARFSQNYLNYLSPPSPTP